MITHFQFRETKGKDYFRKAWAFSFTSQGKFISGIYHQDGTIAWGGDSDIGKNQSELTRELHHLMGFHVFK
jgi:hypothetical protein